MMKHLSDNTRKFVETSSDEARIEKSKEFKWVGYTEAKNAINKIEDCLNYPKVSRMPNLLLVGDSNNGKTVILERIDQKHLPYINPDTQRVINPVVFIQSPPYPDERSFLNSILDKLDAPIKTTENRDSKQLRVKNLLRDLKVQLLMIDEIHHVLAGTQTKQRVFLNILKYYANELRIPLICAGTKKALNAIQTDAQLANRFEPFVLPTWNDNDDYKRLLLSYLKILPLRKESKLLEGSIATKILAKSEGLIGEISKILEKSTVLAIASGIEHITLDILNNIDYQSPTERKKKR